MGLERANPLSSRPFRQLIDTAPDAMVIVNDHGEIVFVNSQTEALFGYRAEELLGQRVEILVPEGLRERYDKHHRHGYLADTPPHARMLENSRGLFGRRKDGTEFPAQISLSPIETDEGQLISSFIRDLSPLAESEERYRSLFNDVPLGLFRSTPEGRLLDANPECLRLLGFENVDQFKGKRAQDLYVDPHDRERYLEEANRLGVVRGFATNLRRRDGTPFPAELSARAIRDAQGKIVRIDGSVADVTQRQNLEAQLIQAQKMEAVGQLAGGIAHDFNNLLGAITVFGELAATDLPEGDQRRADLDGIRDAVERATTLTRQLLAFSRKQVLRLELLDPNAVISNVLRILGRLIGEDVELITRLDGHAGLVRADAGQLEQVLVNLAVNARDAMPSGGRMVITTSRVQADADTARRRGLEREGDYVSIAVSDTGCGMSKEVQERVFEPFFTTKGTRGTGLGLATVYGIVRQSGGHIEVESQPGEGTVFTIHLPRATGVTAETPVVAEVAPRGGSETVLLAEDDPAVRTAVTTVLKRLGYTVLVTRSAEEALGKAAAHAGPIDILVSDVVMPGLNGRQLVEELRRSRPELKALLTSGYAGDTIARRGILESGIPFIEKPFSSLGLAGRVREVLDA